MRGTITDRVIDAVMKVPDVSKVDVHLDVMSDEQRAELKKTLAATTNGRSPSPRRVRPRRSSRSPRARAVSASPP